jgi:DNA-binding GntR family transcriptional regulator
VYQPADRGEMGEVTARVEDAIRTRIASGELRRGDRLPSERDLVAELAVSRSTVRLVLVKLTAEGLIEPQHGRGYFVR